MLRNKKTLAWLNPQWSCQPALEYLNLASFRPCGSDNLPEIRIQEYESSNHNSRTNGKPLRSFKHRSVNF